MERPINRPPKRFEATIALKIDFQAERIREIYGIPVGVTIEIEPPGEPDWIFLREPARLGIVVSVAPVEG